MKKILLSLVLAAAVAAVPTAAQARPGQLDPSFGRHGKLTVKASVGEFELSYAQKPKAAEMAMAALPDGGIVATNESVVLMRRSDGGPARRFGGDGRVSVDPPADWKLELADLAVDSQGRILIAGTLASLTVSHTQDPPEYNGGQTANGPRPRLAIVKRYLPNGSPDPSFGNNGTVTETFAQKPPTGPGPYNYAYSVPAVGLTGLALAPDGDLVLTGYAAAHVTGGCAPPFSGASGRSFLARLQPDGSLDPGFGSGGVLTEEQLEWLISPSIAASGRIATDGTSGGYCWPRGDDPSSRFLTLLANGQPDPGFGENGGLPHPNLSPVTAVSFDPQGRLLVLGHPFETAPLEGGVAEPKWRVRRLLPSGKPDPSFGKHGTAVPKLPPRAILGDLAIDDRGRIVLGGYLPDKTGERNRRFLLTRLSGNGRREPRFGRRGWTTTAFPAGEAAGLDVAVDARGRVVLGGILGDPRSLSNEGLAFARYKSR